MTSYSKLRLEGYQTASLSDSGGIEKLDFYISLFFLFLWYYMSVATSCGIYLVS